MSIRSTLADWLRPRAEEPPAPLVPSQATYAELERLASAGLLGQLGSVYSIQVGGGVVVPYAHPTLLRCITLISSVAAQLVTGGGLSVEDKRTGRRVPYSARSRAGRALDLLTGSPDGLETAYAWIESVMTDLLTSSNYVVRIVRGPGGLPQRLVRQDIATVRVRMTEGGDLVYRSRDWISPVGGLEMYSSYEIAHGVWGGLRLSQGEDWGWEDTSRFMATPLLALLRPALGVGLAGERYVRDFFEGGAAQTPFVVSFNTEITPAQRTELDTYLRNRKGRFPLILGGTKGGEAPNVTQTQTAPQRRDTLDLRRHQDEEVSRAYGMPSPLVGSQTSTWGAGIAELGRLGWRFGFRQHIDRLLSGLERGMLDRGQMFRVDSTDIVRGNPEQVAGAAALLTGGPNSHPIISVPEARRMVGMPRDVDGELAPPMGGSGEGEGTGEGAGLV